MPPAAPATFTSAPGTMAPLVSFTVPVMAPVSCASSGVVANAISKSAHTQTNRDLMFNSVCRQKDRLDCLIAGPNGRGRKVGLLYAAGRKPVTKPLKRVNTALYACPVSRGFEK